MFTHTNEFDFSSNNFFNLYDNNLKSLNMFLKLKSLLKWFRVM